MLLRDEAAMWSRPLERSSLLLHRCDTPIGIALIVTDERGTLRAFDFIDYEARLHKLLRIHYGEVKLRSASIRAELKDRVERYFAGDCAALDGLSCETNGTPFQRQVWQTLRRIPVGSTTTYGALAGQLGMPNAARAVGAANGANPIAIVVPCHRVVGANGSLTGYAGGLHRKQWLLVHERTQLDPG
jgi:methylated-DNA-[protein]-cysteine S-methyltransferase